MALQSLDQVNKNDWLVCIRGPKIILNSPFGENRESVIDHSFEGSIAQVLAILPPIMLVRFYSKPGTTKSTRIPIQWNVAEWSKASRKYVNAYRKKEPKMKSETKNTDENPPTILLVRDIKKT